MWKFMRVYLRQDQSWRRVDICDWCSKTYNDVVYAAFEEMWKVKRRSVSVASKCN